MARFLSPPPLFIRRRFFSKTKAWLLPKHLRCSEKKSSQIPLKPGRTMRKRGGGRVVSSRGSREQRERWHGCGANIDSGISALPLKTNTTRICSGAFIVSGFRKRAECLWANSSVAAVPRAATFGPKRVKKNSEPITADSARCVHYSRSPQLPDFP